jgi:hypothetical protein
MNKGRMIELLRLNNSFVDSAIPNSFFKVMSDHKISRPDFWFAWSYLEDTVAGTPIHLGERFVNMLDESKVTLTDGIEVSLMDLIETIIAHPEEVKITIE